MEGIETDLRNDQRNRIPLKRLYSEAEWTNLFRRYDYDHDDQIPIKDFLDELQEATDGNIPILAIQRALNEADRNGDNVITLDEFLKLVQKSAQGKSRYGSIFTQYVKKTIPPRQRKRVTQVQAQAYSVTDGALDGYYSTDGEYEDEYKFWPPPLGMICLSILEVGTFLYDTAIRGYGYFDGPIATLLIYNPSRRKEAWRFLSYMFVHAGAHHLLVNVAVQLMLGLPLEMVHRWWRVLIVYSAGVLAGSLGTSVWDPHVFLVGASGGVYSLITAHLATIIMNWSEMEFAKWQLLIILILCTLDTGSAIYNRYVLEINQQIGYEAHLAGAIAGLLVGIYTLRNLEVRSWEKMIWWIALILYVILMATAIIINITFPSHFPIQNV